MRKLLLALLILVVCSPAWARDRLSGYCQVQATGARVLGCTVTVYDAGTVNLSTIYADNTGTAKANPFVANATTGYWFFYSDNGRYDVEQVGGTPSISPAYTLSDFVLLDTATAAQGTTFSGDITPVSDNTLNVGTAALTWNAGRFTNLTVDTALTSSGTLAVTGASTLTGAVTTGTTLTAGGNLSVTGTGTFTGAVSGTNGTFTGTLGVTGAATFSSTGSFAGALTVSGASVSVGTSPSTSGVIRIPNNAIITANDSGGTVDTSLLWLDTTDVLRIGAGTGQITQVSGPVAVNGATAASLSGHSVRIPNNSAIVGRNIAGSADVLLIQNTSGSDTVHVGASSGIPLQLGNASGLVSVLGPFQINGRIAQGGVNTFVDLDTTPDVSGGFFFQETNTGATSITAFDSGTNGQVILVLFTTANTTIVDSAGVQLAGGVNFVGSANDTLTLVYLSAVWHEVSRSVN